MRYESCEKYDLVNPYFRKIYLHFEPMTNDQQTKEGKGTPIYNGFEQGPEWQDNLVES